jgi:type VI secretion system protein ImpH
VAPAGAGPAPPLPDPPPPAAPAEGPPAPRGARARLFAEGFAFDFFQAVRLLERLAPERCPVGRAGPPAAEAVRFRAHLSLSFPPSPIYEIEPAAAALPVPAMTVAFMGLTGPSGVLPQHYTELLLRLQRDAKGPEKHALRAWLDLFNHRLISLFYRAWEKYRFFIPYERGEYAGREPEPFTRALFSLVGLGLPPLRNRLRVAVRQETAEGRREQVLARIDDLVLLHYSGFFAHRPRCAVSLEAMLADYFGLAVQVRQLQGQWLLLDADSQTRLGAVGGNCELGVNAVAGDRVWDVQSKFRVRLGPLGYARFREFLPDRSPSPARKSFFLLTHLVRLYVGPELDFDVQLVLAAAEVPECRLTADEADGPRLGWNTWIRTRAMSRDPDDAVFEGEEVVWLGGPKL